MLPEGAFKPRCGRRGMTLEGSGGTPPPMPTQTSQVSIPEYAKPYMESLLGQAGAITGIRPDDPSTKGIDESKLPGAAYQEYKGDRLALATPEQVAARGSVAGMTPSGNFGTATDMATAAGVASLGAGNYAPSGFGTNYATRSYSPTSFNAATVTPERATSATFGADQLKQYSDPFMQAVVDQQKVAAMRDAKIIQKNSSLAAAGQGTYGSGSQLIARTERERALGSQLGGIQAQGLEAAYKNAQEQFERDQARAMTAQGQNLQYGTQAQLANQAAQMDAQKAAEASRQYGSTFGESSAAREAQLSMDAQKAAEQSRQFGTTAGLQGSNQAITAATSLGNLGAQTQTAGIDLAKAQEAFGAMNQQQQQQALEIAYQNYIEQKAYPYKQLGFMSDLLRGSSNLAATGGKTVYEAQPSLAQQMSGAGLLAAGLAREGMKS